MNARQVVVGAWLGMIGIATVREVTKRKSIPSPGPFVYSAIAFTMLYGLAGFAPSLAATFAVGLDVGVVLVPYIKGDAQSGPLFQLDQLLGSISGGGPSNSSTSSSTGGTIAA